MKCGSACTEETVIPEIIMDRARGALFGAALGDALGATVEFMSQAEIRATYGVHDTITGGGWLYLKPGQITDDTEMSLCISRALVKSGGFDLKAIAEEFAKWIRTCPVDVGSTCSQGIQRYILKGQTEVLPSRWHAGNGACMRMAPIAIATLGDDAYLAKCSTAQAHLTHNNLLSDAACIAIGRMVQTGLQGGSRRDLVEIAAALVRRHPEFTYRPYLGKSSGYVAETFATACHYFFSSNCFESCLLGTVNQGGDTDTNGAVAGMIAGAYYGYAELPEKWLKKLDSNVSEEINQFAEPLVRLSPRWSFKLAPSERNISWATA